MPVIVVGDERNVGALKRRLFTGRVSPAVVRAVTESIREANPHADLDRLRPGTVLTVPDAPAVELGGDLSLDASVGDRLDEVAQVAQALVKELVAEGTRAERAGSAERKALAAVLDGNELRDAIGRDRTLAAAVAATRTALEAEEAAAAQRAAAAKQAQTEWTAELEALRGAFG